MAKFTLTAGVDTVVGGPADDTVEVTGDWMLNAGDSLVGGAGTDTLAISGLGGSFRLDQLATSPDLKTSRSPTILLPILIASPLLSFWAASRLQ